MKHLLFCTALLVFASVLHANVLYVKPGKAGNGTSWKDAYASLQTALRHAQPNDQIWVAEGKYLPTNGPDRTASFVIPNGVAIYGGFAGHETALHQRNPNSNPTVLSGEIGTPAIDDNSFTVVQIHNASRATIVDGFIIKGGAANGKGQKGSKQRCGAALYISGNASPTVSNCVFIDNYAREGAGIYTDAQNAVAAPSIENCKFFNNKADIDGGAIFNNSVNGSCRAKIVNCSFARNQATYGGGILNRAGYNADCTPTITACVFEANQSLLRGGSIYDDAQGGKVDPQVQRCSFSDNISTLGKEYAPTASSTKPQGRSTITLRSK